MLITPIGFPRGKASFSFRGYTPRPNFLRANCELNINLAIPPYSVLAAVWDSSLFGSFDVMPNSGHTSRFSLVDPYLLDAADQRRVDPAPILKL